MPIAGARMRPPSISSTSRQPLPMNANVPGKRSGRTSAPSTWSAEGATVCLLESGASDRHLGVKAPAAFPTLFQGTRDWNFLSEPEPGLYGRRWYLPRGRMIGGSSSMNAMFYVRGHRSDFNRWEDDFGARGWRYDDVLPVFKRSEHNEEIHDE